MSPLLILTLVIVLYLCCKPRLKYYIERDGVYLSREWTSFVNALFISLVVCSHGLLLWETNIEDYLPEKYTAGIVKLFGQLMVTTFFFYSGYGIMLSLKRRKGYEKMLMYPRFVSLSLNFLLAVLVYFIVHSILIGEVLWIDFIGGLHEYSALGNPTWYILMTLLAYILTFLSFRLFGNKNDNLFISSLIISLLVLTYLIHIIKPSHWVNTILCFPAGMLYYQYGNKAENLIKHTRIPSIIYAILFIIIGKIFFRNNIYIQNISGIIFAVGVTWLFGSFSWQRLSRGLVWLGGSGLFSVYMFHLLPMRVLTKLGLNDANPYIVWAGCIAITALLVALAGVGYKYLNNLLFSNSK